MDDWEEFESWYEDLMAWERFQDELKRIKGENTYEKTCTTLRIKAYLCSRKPPRNPAQNAATIWWSNSGRLHYLLNYKSKIFSHLKGWFDSWWHHPRNSEVLNSQVFRSFSI